MSTLRVTLIRARDLGACDSGGTSDPFVAFQVGKETLQSSCIHNQLNPVWQPRESFDFPILDPATDILRVRVMDHDSFSEHDTIGTLTVRISKFIDLPSDVPHVEQFMLEIPSEHAEQGYKSSIDLGISILGDAQDKITLRMWENEVWSLTSGWVPSDTEIYRRWSVFDDSETSNTFEKAMPQVPSGMEAEGWAYVSHQHGECGWSYAYNFLGPFSVTAGVASFVRRRLWENRCTRCVSSSN